MKFKYEIGMPIVERDRHARKGKIVELDGDDAFFLWEDETDGERAHWTGDYEVMPDTDEARAQLLEINKKTQAKIDEATSLLEQAFKAWFEAASLQAGRDVGNSEAYYLRGNPDLDLTKFEGVVRDNGWETSSLYC